MLDNIKNQILKQRDAAFERGDVGFFAGVVPNADPFIVRIGFHKARAACLSVSDEKREESREWLRLYNFEVPQ